MINYNILLSRLLGVRRAALRPGITAAARACCPICQPEGPRPGRDPALSVAVAESGKLLAWCHKCQVDGDVILRHIGIQQSASTRAKVKAKQPEHDPGCWISAAAAADALESAVVIMLNGKYHGDQERVLDASFIVHERLNIFKAAVRDACRADARSRGRGEGERRVS